MNTLIENNYLPKDVCTIVFDYLTCEKKHYRDYICFDIYRYISQECDNCKADLTFTCIWKYGINLYCDECNKTNNHKMKHKMYKNSMELFLSRRDYARYYCKQDLNLSSLFNE